MNLCGCKCSCIQCNCINGICNRCGCNNLTIKYQISAEIIECDVCGHKHGYPPFPKS